RLLEEIRPSELMALCDRIKARGAPATAVHTREIVGQVYRHAIGRGLQVENPADKIQASKIAVFKPRDRALSPAEIRAFFTALESVATLPTLKLALRLILLVHELQLRQIGAFPALILRLPGALQPRKRCRRKRRPFAQEPALRQLEIPTG